jgi:hypothetical protein
VNGTGTVWKIRGKGLVWFIVAAILLSKLATPFLNPLKFVCSNIACKPARKPDTLVSLFVL